MHPRKWHGAESHIGHSPVKRPRFGKCINQIRSVLSKVIVDLPAAAYLRDATFYSSFQGEERDNVTCVSVKNLPIGGICGSADQLGRVSFGEILYVGKNTAVRIL